MSIIVLLDVYNKPKKLLSRLRLWSVFTIDTFINREKIVLHKKSSHICKVINGDEVVVGDGNIAEYLNNFFINDGCSVLGQVLLGPRDPAYSLKGNFAQTFLRSPKTSDLVNTIISSLQSNACSSNTFSFIVL